MRAARSLVSTMARLQNWVPVQETRSVRQSGADGQAGFGEGRAHLRGACGGDVDEEEVLFVGEADHGVGSAEAFGEVRRRGHLCTVRRPRSTGTPMYESPGCFCGATPM